MRCAPGGQPHLLRPINLNLPTLRAPRSFRASQCNARPCHREGRAMQHSISYPTPERPTPTEPTASISRLRTVTGNRFPRKCACG